MSVGQSVIVASFVFRQHTKNDEFLVLDDEIMLRAEVNPGFVKKAKWLSPDNKTIRVDYYFNDMDSLQVFSADEIHRVAKRRYSEWYDGYSVEILEVTHSYSEGKL